MITIEYKKVSMITLMLIYLMSIACFHETNAQAVKCNNSIKDDSIVTDRIKVLFSFWENGSFDSLYDHLTCNAKKTIAKDDFVNKQKELFMAFRHKDFKILNCNKIDDSTFQLSFSYALYGRPNSYEFNYSYDSVSNMFQLLHYGKTSWLLVLQKNNTYFNFQ